jgi:hypothetical protein
MTITIMKNDKWSSLQKQKVLKRNHKQCLNKDVSDKAATNVWLKQWVLFGETWGSKNATQVMMITPT